MVIASARESPRSLFSGTPEAEALRAAAAAIPPAAQPLPLLRGERKAAGVQLVDDAPQVGPAATAMWLFDGSVESLLLNSLKSDCKRVSRSDSISGVTDVSILSLKFS